MKTRFKMRPGRSGQGAGRAVGRLIRRGLDTGELRPGDPDRLRLIILATFQGIAALVSSGQVPPGEADALVRDATALFTSG